MMVCPQCGYEERVDWAKILLLLSFVLLISAWIGSDFVPKHEFKWIAFAGFMVGNAGVVVSALRGLVHGKRHDRTAARM
jgi:uncharacterized membrane protein